MISERFEQALPRPLHYDGPLPRRVRKVWRLAHGSAVAARPGRLPVHLRSFWWDGHPNFGDALTPWLLPRYGVVPFHTPPLHASLVGVGSVLEMVPECYTGVVWGAGLMYDAAHYLPHARFLAVRGKLTRARLGLSGGVALGDPGLLVSRHVGRREPEVTLAVVPHGMHAGHPAFTALAERDPREVRVVDVRQSPAHVARRIAGARAVVTSSLHGLVYADSFGIPAVWVTVDRPLRGGEFKFHDYESVLLPGATRHFPLHSGTSVAEVVAAARAVDSDLVTQTADRLERVLLDFRDELRATRSVSQGGSRA